MEQEHEADASDTAERGSDAPGGGAVRVPPYVAYSTFLTLLKELKDNGLPPQLDKSVLKRFAFGVQGQLKMALRALGMLDGDKPTPRLQAFVDAYETDTFGPLLLDVLREVYPYVFALDLNTATPTMFGDAFKQSGAKGEDGLRKCRSFFTHAAKQAGVVFGPRLANGSVPRSSTPTRRKAKATKAEPPVAPPPSENVAGKPKAGGEDILGKLLDKFPAFNPEWPDPIKAQWFTGFEQFMKGAKPK